MPLKLLKRRRIAVLLSGLTMNTAYTATMAAESTVSNADTAGASLDDVTVVSHREGEAVSREKQKDAPNLINTITDEEIRKLPDLNAGEAASRLPGAALSVDTGQGRWVNIRGLDADLTSTTYAGIHLPPTNPVTPQSGGRAFAFDTFPTAMIGSLTITKTNKPEQDAEALGGTIEISPKEIPEGRDQPHLRPDARRFAARQWRSKPRRLRHQYTEPEGIGTALPAARQCIRAEPPIGRRPSLDRLVGFVLFERH
jgi:hypothetical protein